MRETNTDGLVNEEDVRVAVPGILEAFRAIRTSHPTWTCIRTGQLRAVV